MAGGSPAPTDRTDPVSHINTQYDTDEDGVVEQAREADNADTLDQTHLTDISWADVAMAQADVNVSDLGAADANLDLAGNNLLDGATTVYDTANGYVPAGVVQQGAGSGLDADTLDGTQPGNLSVQQASNAGSLGGTSAAAVMDRIAGNTNTALELIQTQSYLRYQHSLEQLEYEDGMYDSFVNNNKITLGSPTPADSLGDEGYGNLTDPVPEPTATFGADGHLAYDFSSSAWDFTYTSYTGTSFDMGSHEGKPNGIAWNNDGTKLFAAGEAGGYGEGQVTEWTLSTAYDISTMSHSHTLDISNQTDMPYSILWFNNGSNFLVGETTTIYEYGCSTAYDLSTASLNTQINTDNGGGERPEGMAWANGGSTLHTIDGYNNAVFEYTLSTDYDITTATLNTSFNTNNDFPVDFTRPEGIWWNSDGTALYISDDWEPLVVKNDVSTAYDISSISSSQKTTPSAYTSRATDILWNSDGTYYYILESTADTVHQFETSGSINPAVFTEETSLGFTPSTVVVSDRRTGDFTLEYIIEDSANNSVHVTESEVGTEVDVSALNDGEIQLTAVMDAPSGQPAESDRFESVAAYFQ